MGCGCRGNSSTKPSAPKPIAKPSTGTTGTPVANPRTVQTVRRTIIRR